jgi:hypothetical protein
MIFTVEESNLITICKSDGRAETAAKLREYANLSEDPDMRDIIESLIGRLSGMTDNDYGRAVIAPVNAVPNE